MERLSSSLTVTQHISNRAEPTVSRFFMFLVLFLIYTFYSLNSTSILFIFKANKVMGPSTGDGESQGPQNIYIKSTGGCSIKIETRSLLFIIVFQSPAHSNISINHYSMKGSIFFCNYIEI